MRMCIQEVCLLSVLCAVFLDLTPEGGAKRVLRILSFFVLLSVLLDGLVQTDLSAYALELARYRSLEQELTREGSEAYDALNRLVIEAEYREYIEERAASLRVYPQSVQISVRWHPEGFWVPDSARIRLPTLTGKEDLEEILRTELGIPRERQEWEVADGLESDTETA